MNPMLRYLMLSCCVLLLAAPRLCSAFSYVSGCVEGDGHARKEVRELPQFDAVQVDGAFEVVVEAGHGPQKVEIEADGNLLSSIVTEVRDGSLFLGTSNSVCPRTRMLVRIQCRIIREIISRGSNRINSTGIENDQLRLEITGAGQAIVAGKTDKLSARVTGSGQLQAQGLSAGDVDVVAEGASSAIVSATGSLNAASTGASQVIYYGNPQLRGMHTSGVGEIIRR